MSQKDSKDGLETDEYVMINISDLKKLRVHELKDKLAELDLPTKGSKAELIQRLETHLSAAADSEEDLTLIDVANNSQPSDSQDAQECGNTGPGNQKTFYPDTSVEKSLLDSTYPSTQESPSKIHFSDSKDSSYSESALKEISFTSQEERIKARSQRFGVESSDEAKKAMRLEKFSSGSGSGSPAKISFGSGDLDKMKQRGERFGENVSKKFVKLSDKERQDLRKTRFSSGANTAPATSKKIRLSTS